ncbi:MAG: segregation/condensation protein A [Candidatus Micrarchaeota archaeon]|nr:segregation/condensation protein A [Candidatus Micrarchaeota archaeon]MDE1804287.1 segregation/condensation protein A [Candidatus Micrarchaeota archaeon]MDE1846852.1 segregation/condensation protein A [Candidatus Micrarchaeota archaeon]
MATTAGLELEATMDPQNMNLEQLVSEATWKDILIDLAHRHKFDPWNVDIVVVVDRYIDAVKGMKVLDLRVPANIILAAAILLRLKSEMLNFEEPAADEGSHEERPIVNVDQLSFRLRIPPRRKITLTELISALEEAMKLKEVREAVEKQAPLPVPISINPIDIEAEIEGVYQQVKKSVDKSNMTTFSILSKGRQLEDALLGLFIPLLFLSHKKKVTLIQERFFDEIIIALNK